MKERHLILFLSVILFASLITSLGVDKTKAYQNSTSISIGIDGINQTIEAIVTTNFVFPSHVYSSVLSLNPGHNFNQIWVSVKDGEMSLFQALNSTNKLCPASPLKNYTSSPADKSQPYHYATEIQLSSGKNLQESIDIGDFCYNWYTNSASCSATCGGGTRTTYCSKNGVQVADSYCYGTKPSVSCNTQGCVWQLQPGSGCVPSTGLDCGSNCCPYNPASKACSPAGTLCITFGGQCTEDHQHVYFIIFVVKLINI